MEPTLRRVAGGASAVSPWSVSSHGDREPARGDIVAFDSPAAAARCGVGGSFVQRIVGLPGEAVAEARRARLRRPHAAATSRTSRSRRVAGERRGRRGSAGSYFLMGDNRRGRAAPARARAVRRRRVVGRSSSATGRRAALRSGSKPSGRVRYHSAASGPPFYMSTIIQEHRAPSAARRAALQGGRHGARPFQGDRGQPPADPGLRGSRDPAPGRRGPRDVHRAQELVRRRRRADVPAALAEDRQDRRRPRSATSTARSCTTSAAGSARRPASASCAS